MSANKTPRVVGALLAAGLGVTAGIQLAHRPANVRHADNVARMTAAYDSLPLSFEPNRGQAPGDVRFSARGDGYGLFLTSNEAVLAMRSPQGSKAKATLLKMHLNGARKNVRSAGVRQLPGISNYFLGKDPSKWRTHVPTYAQVKYDGVYPGVDLLYYGNQRRLEYDFLVQPGANADAIRLGFDGASQISVDRSGDLILDLGGRAVRQHRPVVYQEIGGVRKSVAGRYQLLAKNEVGFALGAYDKSQPLVIDPVLSYSGYLGTADRDVARNVVVDADGNAYLTGVTFAPNFAGVPTALRGATDAFVTKFQADGQSVAYSTYLGGSANENVYLAPDNVTERLAGAVAIDGQRQAYLTGYTDSFDFPLVSPIQVVNGGNGDAFVAKLSASGTIVYSTYLGGRNRDAGNGIAVANAADGPNAYVIGETRSHDFNLANPYQQFKGKDASGTQNDSDAFVTRLNAAGSGLVYSTYLGGGADERGEAIAVGPNGNVYATGVTLSDNFPVTDNAYSQNGVGSSDIFVTKLRDLGAQGDPTQLIEYSSYFGGTGENQATAIAVDRLGRAYVTGYTTSTDLPTGSPAVIPGTYDGSKYGGRSGSQGNFSDGGASDGFLAKFDPSEFGTASLVQATYLGGNGQDVATGVTVSPVSSSPNSGDYVAYVTGWTTSSNYPTVAALRTSLVGGQDIFVSKITAPGSSFEYSTYLGGSFNDVSSGIAVDASGRAYVVGTTQSGNYPVIVTNRGPVGGNSDVVISRLTSPPGAPSTLTGQAVSPTRVDLTWVDNSDNEGDSNGVGFQVERSLSGGAFQVVGSTAPNVNTFSDGLNSALPLQPETSYIYRVRALNTVGASAYSNAITVATLPVPPADPSGLNATPLSQTSIRLDWTDNSSNETAFEIERAPETAPGSGQPGTFAQVGTVGSNVTTFTNNGLSVFTTYFYRVRASNAGGASAYAGPVQTRTLDNVPAAPTNLSAVTVSNTSIQLSWNDQANNELGFEVQRSLDGVNYTSVTTSLISNSTSYTDSGLAGNTTYTYRVRAFNSGGNSAFTNEASATTFPNPPSAPTGLTVTVPAAPNGITKLALSWTDTSNNESGFKIERSADDFADPLNTTLVATVGANVTGYTDTGLTPVTKYYYRVRATNAGGDSANSNTANGTTLPNPPAAPSTLTGTALSQTSIKLDWVDNSTNETGFKVERSLNGTVFNVTFNVSANEVSYTDTGLNANTTYYYRVRATNTGGDSAPSNTVSVTTLPTPPSAPTGLTGSLQVTTNPYALQVNLNWSDTSNNETGFKIERSADGTTYGLITTVAAGTQSYADTTVAPDGKYSYRVIATNAGGDSPASNVVSVDTPPAAPTNARLSGITNNSVQLFWNDNSQRETNFRIQRSTDGVNFSNLTQVNNDITTLTDTGLTGDTTYYYRVYAVNAAGTSDASNIISGKTLPTAPAAPSNLTATATSQTQINLAWTDNSNNESGFKIERSTDSTNFSQIAVVDAGVTSYNDTLLNLGTHYWYRVRAYNAGGDSGNSNTADASTYPAAPTGPTGLKVSVLSSSSLSLTWNDNSSNEDSFKIERATNGSFTENLQTVTVAGGSSATATYTDSTVAANKTYYYRVAAVNLGGVSGYSNPASALTLPGAPTQLNAESLSGGSIQVSWTAPVGGADGYVVEHSNSANPAFTVIGRVAGNVTSLVDSGLNANSTFTYRVLAQNRSGSSAYSNQDTATTSIGVVSVTTNKSSIKGGSQLTITVTLTGSAPSGGATVALTSLGDGGANIKLPVTGSITVPAGSSSASIKVKTRKPKKTVVATITATYGGSSQSTNVTVKK